MAIDWANTWAFVTGGCGFLGRALCRELRKHDCKEVVAPGHDDVDLLDFDEIVVELGYTRPDIVFHLAGEVGGIGANMAHPGQLFYRNMAMGLNVIEAARGCGVKKLIQVGTVCAYPKNCPVPFREADLWNGYPEETNAPYGIAKKALLVMLQAYRNEYGFDGVYVLLANLYGPGDNFNPETSHVIPGLIRKFDEAKSQGCASVTCWGTGQASREFLYVDDAAEAIVRAAERLDDSEPVNIGTGHEITIADLASRIAEIVGFEGRIEWDASRPDGQPRRQLDKSRAAELLQWQAKVDLDTGLKHTVEWWAQQHV